VATSPIPSPVGRHWTSRLLHTVGAASSHSAAGVVVASLIVAWTVFGFLIGFPNWWDNALYIASSVITLVMVFAIQHTQSRQQAATQRKLDELLLSQPRADDRLVAVEESPDGELERLTAAHIAERERALRDE
jgi:low affinity Fe/Cu permease